MIDSVNDFTGGFISQHLSLKLEFDGACEPVNPGGVATFGWRILTEPDHLILVQACGVIADGGENATNNVAEYCALGKALRWLSEQGWKGKLKIVGDSKLVIEQMNQRWQCKALHLRRLRDRATEILSQMGLDLGSTVTIEWIPREKNEAADQLSKQAYEDHVNARH